MRLAIETSEVSNAPGAGLDGNGSVRLGRKCEQVKAMSAIFGAEKADFGGYHHHVWIIWIDLYVANVCGCFSSSARACGIGSLQQLSNHLPGCAAIDRLEN